MPKPKVEYLTLHALSIAINDPEFPYEMMVEIVKKDRYFTKASNEEIDKFLTKLFEKLNA